MMKLNAQQLEAVRYLGGPLFVLAGAGSGKTGVITQKIKHLIVNVGYLPHTVAAITFTNKAAAEMQERVAKMLPKPQTRGLTICTFHSLGMKILHEEANHIGYKKNFSILDSTDSAKIIGELLGGTGKEAVFKAQHQISLWKNDLKTPEDVVQTASNVWEQQTARVYASYQETLQSYQAVDFDDLIRLPAVLLQQNSEVRNKWQRRLRYLLVDECQDTNTCQFALMKLLTGAEGMFTAVGDDDQSIYAWRGANMENLRKMQENYPQMKVIKLEQNYRSTARILKIANKVIENNPKLFTKKLWSQLGEGEPVKVVACQNEQHEADWVVSQIVKQKLIGGDKTRYADFAVLYRGKHQARIFEEALRGARIPYRLSGGQSFFDKAEIKDVLSYVRLLANPNDDPAFLRAVTTPKRGIGDVTLGKLNAYAHEHECSLYEAAQNEEALATLNNTNRQHLQAFMDMFGNYRAKAEIDEAGEFINSLLEEIDYENHLMQNEEGKAGEIKWRNVGELVSWFATKRRTGRQKRHRTRPNRRLDDAFGRKRRRRNRCRLAIHAARRQRFGVSVCFPCRLRRRCFAAQRQHRRRQRRRRTPPDVRRHHPCQTPTHADPLCQTQKTRHMAIPRTQPIHRRNAAGRFENPGAQRRRTDCQQRRRQT